MSKPVLVTILTTLYFLFYAVMYFTGASAPVIVGMLMISPIVLIYWVYVVVTDRKYDTRDLKEDEEFSYRDFPEASEEKKQK